MSKLKLSIVVLLTLAILPFASASAIPEIKLFPETGVATTIQGTGFAPWQNVKIYWNDTTTATQMITLPYGAMLFAGPSGTFVAMITALDQNGGVYNITASNSIDKASTWFTVPNYNGLDGEDGADSTVEGPKGDAGSVWFSGNIDPTPATGKDGDFYLHTTTSDVWKRVLGVWGVETNIKGLTGEQGIQGIQGEQGIQGLQGEQGIQGIQGEIGLTGLQGEHGLIGPQGIQGIAGNDGDQGLTGEKGEKGDTGEQGPSGSTEGLDGNMWYSGDGVTYPPDIKTGDFYLNTLTYNVTQKTDEDWVFIANIKGEEGGQGEAGGIGPQGVAGHDGTRWFTGTLATNAPTFPTLTLGSVEGDLYLKTSTSDVYKKVDGVWVLLMNIMGEAGAVGERGLTGLTGATGVIGAVGPMGPRGQVGETGAVGAQGIQGIQGVKGEMGDIGDTGAQGAIGLTGLAGKDADTNMLYGALIMAFISLLGVAWVYRKQSEYE